MPYGIDFFIRVDTVGASPPVAGRSNRREAMNPSAITPPRSAP